MIEIIKELDVEVTKPNIFQAIVAKQYDMNTRFLKVTLKDFGTRIDVPNKETVKVVINAERKDGQSKGFDGVVNADGTVTVPLHSWMLELDGEVICDISVIDTAEGDNKKLTTTSFTLKVEKAAYGGNDITSDPQYDVLVSLIEQVETISATKSYVLDSADDLQDFIYNKNLLPPFADGVVDMGSFAYEITHNTDGTANIEFTGEVPEGFNGMGSLNGVAPGTYTFSSNIPNASLIISDGTCAYNGDTFTVTDEGCGATFTPIIDHNMENIWFQLEKGNKATEFTPYGKPRAELNEGDIFLIKEDGTPDYWWTGTEEKPMEADLGDIETALDSIIAIQEELIGGDA